jgi:hypothetical protein
VLVAWFSPDPPPVQAGFGYPTRVRHAVFARAFLSSMVLLRAFHRSPSRRCCVSSARDLGAVARARAVIFSVSIGAGSSCVQGNPSRSRFVVRWWLASKALDPSDSIARVACATRDWLSPRVGLWLDTRPLDRLQAGLG